MPTELSVEQAPVVTTADIPVVTGNPLEEIEVLGEASLVLHRGTVVYEVPVE